MSKIGNPEIKPSLIKFSKVGMLEDAEHPDSSAGDGVRYGHMFTPPVVGECFYFSSIRGGGGHLRTSTVTEVMDQNNFKTRNSHYRIDFIKICDLPEHLKDGSDNN